MSAPTHLGGYIVGGDPATYYPELWSWLIVEHGCNWVIDVGCGDGVALNYFRDATCKVLGVEGVPQDDPDIVLHDYTTGPLDLDEEYDLVWCCEFVEHVEEQYVPNFLVTFQAASLVVMTHAFPGQIGHHHVNCQSQDYWVGAMAAIGYQLNLRMTQEARAQALYNTNPYNHFARSGLVFER